LSHTLDIAFAGVAVVLVIGSLILIHGKAGQLASAAEAAYQDPSRIASRRPIRNCGEQTPVGPILVCVAHARRTWLKPTV